MTGSRNIPHSYTEAMAMLEGQCKYRRKVGNNTYVERDIFCATLSLHGHRIAEYLDDGGIVLYTRGWYTNTTRNRLSQAISPLSVIQRNWTWYVYDPRSREEVPFYNGMVVYPQEVRK